MSHFGCEFALALHQSLGQNEHAFEECYLKFNLTLDMRGNLMQVFSRRVNEGLVIGDVFVTVLAIRDDHVRLGISCPTTIPSYWEQRLYLRSEDEGDDDGEFSLSVAPGEFGSPCGFEA
jgi:carbon storage regulator CsrA